MDHYELSQREYERYYNGKLEKGDFFKLDGIDYLIFEITGEIGVERGATTEVTAFNRNNDRKFLHYLYLGPHEVSNGTTSSSALDISVSKGGPHYETAKAYRDQDGCVFLRTTDGWTDSSGTFWADGDSYVSVPMEGPLS